MFEGRVAVVTGAAGGLGRAIALELAKQGAKVVIGLIRKADSLNDIAHILKHSGMQVDVTDRKAMQQVTTEIITEFGSIDVLVTAAGILQPPPLSVQAITERQFDKVVDVNFKGTWNALSLVGNEMLRRGSGSIVTVASITALEPGPLVPYGPTKAAIIEMTKSFAGAWGRSGVRVNCVAPGFTATPALSRGVEFGLLDIHQLAGLTALGRLPNADEIAQAVCFLAGDKASAITGAMLPVDCGTLAMHGFKALDRSIKP